MLPIAGWQAAACPAQGGRRGAGAAVPSLPGRRQQPSSACPCGSPTWLQAPGTQRRRHVGAAQRKLSQAQAVQHMRRCLVGPHDSRAVGVPPCMQRSVQWKQPVRQWGAALHATPARCRHQPEAVASSSTCESALCNVHVSAGQPAAAVWVRVPVQDPASRGSKAAVPHSAVNNSTCKGRKALADRQGLTCEAGCGSGCAAGAARAARTPLDC